MSRFKAAFFATLIIAALLASAAPVRAAFPGANGKIAYVREVLVEGFRTGHIWVMNPEGSGQTDLSGAAGNRDSEPAWSADGSKIAFVSNGQGKCGGDGRIAGGGGNDTITDCDGPPCSGVHGKVLGGSGNDEITAFGRADLLSGGDGKDTILAKNGVKDVISGGPGRDKAQIDKRLDKVSGVERFI